MSFSELYLIYYPKLVRFAKEFVMSEEDEKSLLLNGSRRESKRFTDQLLYIHLIINSL